MLHVEKDGLLYQVAGVRSNKERGILLRQQKDDSYNS